ncbi:hypothetical protein ACIRQQ_43125 [Streptomyces fuscichromogenes]|uniref:hypothetical protein n=1 Tax=Streptomyces fuscichromogenes TaxID=1324013 RepID=UPI0037FA53FB
MTEQANSQASSTVNSHPQAVLRLLPWPTPEGKPCYLVTDSSGGDLSRLADSLETTQLTTGTAALGQARQVLDDPMSPYAEIRYVGLRLAECLTDALRIAESRGMRLAVPVDAEDHEDTHRQAARNTGNGQRP